MTTTPKPEAVGHTAGPWWLTNVRLRYGRGWRYNVKCSPRDTVNDGVSDLAAWAFGKTDREAFANAKLIAASPDLLAALKSLRAIIHDDLTHAQQQHHAEAINFADLVIAKAGGGK